MGTKLTAKAVEWLVEKAKRHVQPDGSVNTTETESVSLLGLVDRNVVFTPVSQLREKADFKHRLPKEQWWLKIRPLLRILAKHDSIYQTSAVVTDADSVDKHDNLVG